MKFYIQEKADITELEVHIICKKDDPEAANIISYLSERQHQILVKKTRDDRYQIEKLAIDDIYYIESVDKHNFIYTKDSVYEIDKKLYELEELLPLKKFIRISKSVIVNIIKVKAIEPEEGRRLKLTLMNKERVMISRNYVASFKQVIGIEG